MYPNARNLVYLTLFFHLTVSAQERVRVDIRTDKGCTYSELVKPEKVEIRKLSTVTWDGKCKGGYLDGFGNLTLKDAEGGMQKVSTTYINGLENGKGTSISESPKIKTIFNGSWINGYWINGTLEVTQTPGVSFTYEGAFQENKYFGEGKLEYFDGTLFKGFFQEGKLTKGKVTYKNGVVYEGEFSNLALRPEGIGILTYPNGMKVSGKFIDGKISDKVEVKFPDGRLYDGIFDLNTLQPNGFGTMSMNDGTTLQSNFSQGKMSDKGILNFSNGDFYEGDFVNNQRTGQGVYKWKNSRTYKGAFKNGFLNGMGYFVNPDGEVAEGVHINGKMDGNWTIRRTNGDKFSIQYKDGERVSVSSNQSKAALDQVNRQHGIDSMNCEAYAKGQTANQQAVAPPGPTGLGSFLSILSQTALIGMNTQEYYDSCMKRLGR
jgi:hypothetical protein